MVDMMFALQHLHKNLLVHMDVKPDNIFLTIDTPTRYKLGDFGIIVCLKEKVMRFFLCIVRMQSCCMHRIMLFHYNIVYDRHCNFYT